MDAKEYVNSLKRSNRVIRLAHFSGEECDGRGDALVIDETESIAIMIMECNATETGIRTGAIVKFGNHPEAERRIIGEAAYLRE